MTILHVPAQYGSIYTAATTASTGDTIEVVNGLPQENVTIYTDGLIFAGPGGFIYNQQRHTIVLGVGVTKVSSAATDVSDVFNLHSIFQFVDNGLNNTIRTGATNDFVTLTGGHDVVHLGTGLDDTLEIDWRNATTPVTGSISSKASTLVSGLSNSVRAVGVENFSLRLTSGADNVSVEAPLSVGPIVNLLNHVTVRAGAGDDIVQVKSEVIYLDGGEGIDWLKLDLGASRLAYNGFGYDMNLTRATSDNIGQWFGKDVGLVGKIQGFERLDFIGGIGHNVITTYRGNFDDSIDLTRSGFGNEVSVFGGHDVVRFSLNNNYLQFNSLVVDYSSSVFAISGSSSAGFFSAGENSRVDFSGADKFIVKAGIANDTIITSDGEDYLDGGKGADIMNGGLGDDRYVVDQTADKIIDSGGKDTVESKISLALSVFPDIENLALLGNANLNGYGNSNANSVFGNSGNNRLYGGSDKLVDQLNGRDGSDTYVIRSSEDLVEDTGTVGTDTIEATVSVVLGLYSAALGRYLNYGIENVRLVGTANINATGASETQHLWGNAGNNTLDGGDSGLNSRIDILEGGLGNDTYVLTDHYDIVIDTGGTDLITSVITRSLGDHADIENLTLLDAAVGYVSLAKDAKGNALDNVLTGNGNNNLLEGLGGSDILYGGLGDDTLVGGNGVDKLYGGAGSDTYFTDGQDVLVELSEPQTDFDGVVSSVSFTLGANFEGLGLLETGEINGTGNELNNTIQGNNSANILQGMAGEDYLEGRGGKDQLSGGDGNDVLAGGSHNDILNGGDGSDLFVFDTALSSTSNVDVISDFTSQDLIALDHAIFNSIGAGVSSDTFRVIPTGTVLQGLDASDRIIYIQSTGSLYYDSDGAGSAATATLFARVAANTALHDYDFTIVF